jgi:predicted ester cyclase
MFLVAEGDKVAFHGHWIATQTGPTGPFPASGKQMDLQFSGIHRIENGKIVETWVTWDNLSGFVQLGHMEPPGAEPAAEPVVEE